MGWKIVRDNQEFWSKAHGVSGQWRKSVTPIDGLSKKLFEEAAEFVEALDPGELYDLRDVVDELISRLDATGEHAADHEVKTARLGTFTRCVEWSPVPLSQ